MPPLTKTWKGVSQASVMDLCFQLERQPQLRITVQVGSLHESLKEGRKYPQRSRPTLTRSALSRFFEGAV